MIVRGDERMLVQGITGRQGTFWTERMQAYGSRIVAGVNPKRAGETHCGVPVYASARDAAAQGDIDVSVLFIPPLAVRDAALEAFPDAGWDVDSRQDAAPGLRRNIRRLAEYLTLIGLTALVIGGVGVANAVSAATGRRVRRLPILQSGA